MIESFKDNLILKPDDREREIVDEEKKRLERLRKEKEKEEEDEEIEE